MLMAEQPTCDIFVIKELCGRKMKNSKVCLLLFFSLLLAFLLIEGIQKKYIKIVTPFSFNLCQTYRYFHKGNFSFGYYELMLKLNRWKMHP